MSENQKKSLYLIASSTLLTILASFLKLNGIWGFISFLIPYLLVGYPVIKAAFLNMVGGEVFDENFLMTIATLGAFAISEYPEAVAVMIFYQLGEFFQARATNKSRDSIKDLMNIIPEKANVIRGDEEVEIDPEEINLGDILLVRVGEKVPVDGLVVEGSTSLDTSALTGESLPLDVKEGDKVISGSINKSGLIKIRALSAYDESTVSKILEMVEEASDKKTKMESFITRFARVYTPVVVISAVFLAIIPPVFFQGNWEKWIYRALTFLVVSCPCALVVSVPVAFFGAIGRASRLGILIKGSSYIEILSKVNKMVFDKTGTLTEGRFEVEAIHPESDRDFILEIAATAERYSKHPVAESIVKEYELKNANRQVKKDIEIEEIPGKGIKAKIDGINYYVGNDKLMNDGSISWEPCHIEGTTIHVAREKNYLGHIIINDKIKDGTKKALEDIRKSGIDNLIMLTGDRKNIAEKVARELGMDKAYSELLPNDKVREIEKILKSGKVCFVGDGINDAPVLKRADLGIAMGAYGSDAAIEACDIVLWEDKIEKIATARRLSKVTMKIVKENIIFSLFVKFAILILGALGLANMWMAVFGDVGVTLIAVLNSMRTLKIK